MESFQHHKLVENLFEWVTVNEPSLVDAAVTDTLVTLSSAIPPLIGGFRPDLFSASIEQGKAVIGEAKTSSDLHNSHTVSQLTSFIDYLRYKPDGILLLSVELIDYQSGKAMTRRLLRQSGCLNSIRLVVITPLDFLS